MASSHTFGCRRYFLFVVVPGWADGSPVRLPGGRLSVVESSLRYGSSAELLRWSVSNGAMGRPVLSKIARWSFYRMGVSLWLADTPLPDLQLSVNRGKAARASS